MIAEVIVDVLNSNIDRIFDYVIPQEMRNHMAVGSRVWVPFAGRGVEGIVVKCKAESSVAQNKLKTILRALDKAPVISEEFVQLMWHMSVKNHMLLADILRLFIPAQMRGGRVKDKVATYIMLGSLEAVNGLQCKSNAKTQQALIDYMRECDGVAVKKSELTQLFSVSTINTLIKKKALIAVGKRVSRTPYESLADGKKTVPALTAEQTAVLNIITASLQTDKKFLLHGVTGSGKTEIYLHCIAECLKIQKTAILLVPEIALTPQMLQVFRARFGSDVAILHSGLSAGERYDEWWRLKTGAAKIAIGARSAVFAPLENIGIVIIDEEHEQSYVADGSRFITVDVAEFRCKYHNCLLLLGSATPSTETYYRAERGELELLVLGNRINRRPMPAFSIADMREELRAGNSTIFSQELRNKLNACIAADNQAMLFINRRGYASIVMCKECGYVAKCDDCDVTLTYHRDEDVLKCHYCSKRFKMLDVCPSCGSKYIRQGGLGTERVVYELQKMYPRNNILRMDNDTTQTKESHLQIVRDFSEKKANILVGTQMIAKGHDFKDVSLVGILDADLSLYFSDYRSTERTFQLITQVAGRAGRADVEGAVVLQTYSPDHYIFKLAVEHNYTGFYQREIALRQAAHYPPFAKIVRIVVSGEEEALAIEVLKRIYLDTQKLYEKYRESFIYLNKMRAPVKRIQRKYRYQILARLAGNQTDYLIDILYDICDAVKCKDVTTFVEINPNSMY